MASLSARCIETRGRRRLILAALLGALSILAMAPFHLSPVLFATVPGLIWLLDGAVRQAPRAAALPAGLRARLDHPVARAFAIGWSFGFGYHAVGLFWIGEAFLVEAEIFAPLLPLAVTLMPAGLALFWGAATALAIAARRPGLARVLALALALSLAEWLRGHVLTGLPWNVLGYALTWPLPLMQTASVIGIYGLTLLAVILFALPGLVAVEGTTGAGGRPVLAALLLAGLPLLLLVAGTALLGPTPVATGEGIKVRLVQPSIVQREKWQSQHQERIFATHLRLSTTDPRGTDDGATGIGLIIWPEAAMPFLPLHAPAALDAIGRMLPAGAVLLSGALRLEADLPGVPPRRRRVFNSLMAFGSGGKLLASYDKVHLVPFGEYLPLQATLEAIGLQQLVRLRGGFTAGARPRPHLTLPGMPKLGPLICYEAIFPGAVVQGGARPAALVNVTNDGWFGNTTGPRQHLHQARVRAVEEGLPLLRAANNGISAAFDGKGRLLGSLGLDEVGVIDVRLPPPLRPPVYARLGDAVFLGLWLLALAVLLAGIRRDRAPGRPPARSATPDVQSSA